MTHDQLLEAVEKALQAPPTPEFEKLLVAMREYLLLPVPVPPKSLTTAVLDRIHGFGKLSPLHKQEFYERVVGVEPIRIGQVWVSKPHILNPGYIKITSFNERKIFGDDREGYQHEYRYEGFQDSWQLQEEADYEPPENANAIDKAYELGLQDAREIVEKTVNGINEKWELAHRFRVKKAAKPILIESTDRLVHLMLDPGEVVHHWRKKP